MIFRVLHISDMHFTEETTQEWIKRDKILEKIQTERICADCLVISGDLFHRGCLDEDSARNCIDYICNLKNSLRAESVLVVPGNHDLDRFARCTKVGGQYNIYVNRRDVVCQAGKRMGDDRQEYSIADEDIKRVLYKEAFDTFFLFSQKIGSQSFNNPGADLLPEKYEVQKILLPFPENSKCGVRFVLMNTALFAGQAVRGEDFFKRRGDLEKKRTGAIQDGNRIKAAEVSVEIARKQHEIELYGEIIVDDECDGRLGLSSQGNRYISNSHFREEEERQAVFTIFVGHHGYDYLSRGTRQALSTAMTVCQSGIYLCGHAHLARYYRTAINPTTTPRDLQQIQSGVMYDDAEDYAQYSFNYITIDYENGSVKTEALCYYLSKVPSQEFRWQVERIDLGTMNVQIPHAIDASRDGDRENIINHRLPTTNELQQKIKEEKRK